MMPEDLPTLDANTEHASAPSPASTAAPSRPQMEAVREMFPPLPRWEHLALGAIVALAAFLDFFQLTPEGFPNGYYATAVKSMGQNWHNFYFLAFDPGGFVTLDKPPLGFWLQTLSAKLFGFSGFSVVLPQALAGIVSVVILYHLVSRVFGRTAGLSASLVLALSPINVVANRTNIVDSLLTLVMLCAAWAVLKATETAKLRWLLIGGALIGIGFNIKTLEAYLVVPALVLLFLLGTALPWWKRSVWLGLMLAVMVAVSFSWSLSVDLTPARNRPYVGSSMTNSEIELAFGYNGVQRIHNIDASAHPQPETSHVPRRDVSAPRSAKTPATMQDPGPLRLINPYLGEQVGWFLPVALLSLWTSAWQWRSGARPRKWCQPCTQRQQGCILWGTWAIVAGVVFSIATFFSPYYLVVFTPALAALVGIGVVALWSDFWERGSWLLPLAILTTGGEQIYLLSASPGWQAWLRAVLVVGACVVTAALTTVRLYRKRGERARIAGGPLLRHAVDGALLPIALCLMLLAPTLWTFGSLRPANASDHPISGPTVRGPTFVPPPHADPQLISYLLGHRNDAQFLAATLTTSAATPIIFDTEAPVMAMGGFSGNNPILTPDDLARLVQHNVVRLFYLPSTNLPAAAIRQFYPALTQVPPTHYTNALTRWVSTTCRPVPPRAWNLLYSERHLDALALFTCQP